MSLPVCLYFIRYWAIRAFYLFALVLLLNTDYNLQQLRMFGNDYFSLVLVCEDIGPRYGLGQGFLFDCFFQFKSSLFYYIYVIYEVLKHLFITFLG